MSADRPFRFFDNREKYLLFVTTCSEKWAIGQRIGAELPALTPAPPALRVFDAGTGDGTVMASVLRQLHGQPEARRRAHALARAAGGVVVGVHGRRTRERRRGRPRSMDEGGWRPSPDFAMLAQ